MVFETLSAWLITAFVHLGLLLGLTRLLTAKLSSGPWRERLWRLALFGALASASVQTIAGNGPLVWRVTSTTQAMTTLPVVSSGSPVTSHQTPRAVTSEVAHSPVSASEAGKSAMSTWRLTSILLVTCWIGIALFLAARQARVRRRFLTSLRLSQRSASALLNEELRALLPRERGKQRARLALSKGLSSPVALSTGEIFLPERASQELGEDELRATLAHELSHVLRRDPTWLRVYSLLEALFFFQPLVTHATAALRAEAELACDDWAVERGADPLGLARALARIADWMPTARVPVTAMVGRESGLVGRVRRLTEPRNHTGSVAGAAFASALLVMTLGVFACGGPGVHSGGELQSTRLDDDAKLIVRITSAEQLIVEDQEYRVPEEWAQFHAHLQQHGAFSPETYGAETSDLSVIIDAEAGVTFRPVQKLMEELARARVWRIEFVTFGERTVAVPLPHDVDDMPIPIEEVEIDGEFVPLSVPTIAERVEIRLKLQSSSPRRIQYSVGPHETNDLTELERRLIELRESSSLGRVIVDARPGILYGDVTALLDSLDRAGVSREGIVFVGAYE